MLIGAWFNKLLSSQVMDGYRVIKLWVKIFINIMSVFSKKKVIYKKYVYSKKI